MIAPDDPRHGERRGWDTGCRCDACTTAWRRYNKQAKVRGRLGQTWKVPVYRAQRRIQALLALGWSAREIAEAGGLPDGRDVTRILNGRTRADEPKWVERKTFTAICRAYDRLAMTIPPPKHARDRDRRRALAKGFAPPLAWDDIDNPYDHPKGLRAESA